MIPKKRKDRIILIAKVGLIVFVFGFWAFMFMDFNVLFTNQRATLWVHCPSVLEEGENFTITVEAWDQYERLAGDYQGKIHFGMESYNYSDPVLGILPSVQWSVEGTEQKFTSNFIWQGIWPAYAVEGADNGRKTFEGNISTPGLHYVTVTDEDSGETFRSNPILVYSKGSSFKRLYWGDIHAHTLYSDGSGSPEEAYQFARDVACLDFAGLTDHAEIFPRLGDIDLFGRFQSYIATTNQFNDPGKFATIVALEWTPMLNGFRDYLSPGHINVYFAGDTMPFFSTFTHTNPQSLFSYIDVSSEDKFLAWQHHTTRQDYGSDFGFYNASINRMVEIYSCHGSSEFIGDLNLYEMVHSFPEDAHGYSINDALQMGQKLGFMASSDGHDGRFGHFIGHTQARTLTLKPFSLAAYQYGVPYPGGLTGIYASQLTRTDIFGALNNRSAFASTWVNRPIMRFSINNVAVGENNSTVIVPSATSDRNISLFLAADGVSMQPGAKVTIEKVEIFKNSLLWQVLEVNDIAVWWNLTDNTAITGTQYTHCIQKADGQWYVHEKSLNPVNPSDLNTHGADYYYTRMSVSSGGAAWIGPIWVSV